jgi:transposase-like protein
MKRRLSVTAEFKQAAVSRVAAGATLSDVAADLAIHRQRLYEWACSAASCIV